MIAMCISKGPLEEHQAIILCFSRGFNKWWLNTNNLVEKTQIGAIRAREEEPEVLANELVPRNQRMLEAVKLMEVLTS